MSLSGVKQQMSGGNIGRGKTNTPVKTVAKAPPPPEKPKTIYDNLQKGKISVKELKQIMKKDLVIPDAGGARYSKQEFEKIFKDAFSDKGSHVDLWEYKTILRKLRSKESKPISGESLTKIRREKDFWAKPGFRGKY